MIENEEGSLTIETSLVFPLYIIFFILMISILIYIYNISIKRINFNNDIEMKLEDYEYINEKAEIDIDNEIPFQNIISKIYKGEVKNNSKYALNLYKNSKIDNINKIDAKNSLIKKINST